MPRVCECLVTRQQQATSLQAMLGRNTLDTLQWTPSQWCRGLHSRVGVTHPPPRQWAWLPPNRAVGPDGPDVTSGGPTSHTSTESPGGPSSHAAVNSAGLAEIVGEHWEHCEKTSQSFQFRGMAVRLSWLWTQLHTPDGTAAHYFMQGVSCKCGCGPQLRPEGTRWGCKLAGWGVKTVA